ncbi:lipoprotein [Spiroplasma taiwanense]|uniref:Lipoprotein n=1 Tax=Spiroplasma taiwanense CT-1 TaxID=1276220 RepID=S5MHQ0_9MOLU|nr:lipoprotein [Spiroplasma taiwanense]AGR41400.1 hypothetical protein STAIW_v1c08120 [Spiroplasma taiwanense CT-1]
MKKLLGFLGAVSITASTTITVVACNNANIPTEEEFN